MQMLSPFHDDTHRTPLLPNMLILCKYCKHINHVLLFRFAETSEFRSKNLCCNCRIGFCVQVQWPSFAYVLSLTHTLVQWLSMGKSLFSSGSAAHTSLSKNLPRSFRGLHCVGARFSISNTAAIFISKEKKKNGDNFFFLLF